MMTLFQRIYHALVPNGRIDQDLEEAIKATKKLAKAVDACAGRSVEDLAQEFDDEFDHHP